MVGDLRELGHNRGGTDFERVKLGVDGACEAFANARDPIQILEEEGNGVVIIEDVRVSEEVAPPETEDIQQRLRHGVEDAVALEVGASTSGFATSANIIEMAADELEDGADDVRFYVGAAGDETGEVGNRGFSKDGGTEVVEGELDAGPCELIDEMFGCLGEMEEEELCVSRAVVW